MVDFHNGNIFQITENSTCFFLHLLYIGGRWHEASSTNQLTIMQVGTTHTPATLQGGHPFYGRPVPLYIGEYNPDPAGMCHACYSPAELGLPEGHPTFTRPDLQGGVYNAALFPIPEAERGGEVAA